MQSSSFGSSLNAGGGAGRFGGVSASLSNVGNVHGGVAAATPRLPRLPTLAKKNTVRSKQPLRAAGPEVEVVTAETDEELKKKEEDKEEKATLFKAIGVGALVSMSLGILDHDWVGAHQELSLTIVFIIGYIGIILEEELAFNKSGVGLVMAVALWTIRVLHSGPGEVDPELQEKLGETSEVLFFLMGAMTIVEIVDAHQGFNLITKSIKAKTNKELLYIIGTITFFMSAILDNLTSTIVMVSLLRKLIPDPDRRKYFGAAVVIAANAGGAWTPIGDVTTTMLWINGNLSTFATMRDIFLPSVVSLAVPMWIMGEFAEEAQGACDRNVGCLVDPDNPDGPMLEEDNPNDEVELAPSGKIIFFFGVGCLLFVPVFKSLTGLPPYLGMLAGLGSLWLLTDAIHYGEEERSQLKVPDALSRIDTQGVLFFLGILMSIASLDTAGLLKDLAELLENNIPSQEIVATVIGLASAVIDNVPLVAATMGMYDTTQYPMDDELWQLIAYCAGTGGSILIIGSAAGVAFMGMEKANFGWYFQKISGPALAGYLAGVGTYLGVHYGGAMLGAAPAIAAGASDVIDVLPL